MGVTVGQTVLYRLSADDCDQISRRRTTGALIAECMKQSVLSADLPAVPIYGWPVGAQAHIGNTPSPGDIVPLIVVRIWPGEGGPGVTGVNGQAILDGNDVLWVTSVHEGTEHGQWSWPAMGTIKKVEGEHE